MNRTTGVSGAPTGHARGPALLIAAGTVVLHAVCATAYGYHRDEFYFLAESKRLDWAFASEPPFTPLLGRLSTTLFGDSLLGLRLWPALAGAAVVLLTTLIARDLGGGRRAQVIAGLAMGTATVSLSMFHLFGPSAFDQLAWAGCLWLLLRLVRGADPRWWLGFGLVAGLGFQNKQTLALLGLALPVALLLTPAQRRHAATPWPWLGALLALAIAAPVLVWQAAHDWPMLAVSASIRADEGGLAGAALFLPMQVVTMNPLLAPVWVAGLWWLFRTVEFRLFGWLSVVLLVLLMGVGGKYYYLAPMYVVLVRGGRGGRGALVPAAGAGAGRGRRGGAGRGADGAAGPARVRAPGPADHRPQPGARGDHRLARVRPAGRRGPRHDGARCGGVDVELRPGGRDRTARRAVRPGATGQRPQQLLALGAARRLRARSRRRFRRRPRPRSEVRFGGPRGHHRQRRGRGERGAGHSTLDLPGPGQAVGGAVAGVPALRSLTPMHHDRQERWRFFLT
ncbi:glycosyltransferase family 39 protein [Amycolatopsis sp. 195334CR]|uniref:glycosyltransferase family 39 protein n=1 Tax=Amycolatopsis sp. 195334CR TaxID=2814588 RepID=UPI001A8FA675|nr:glycosyltransferase family 39 protein [Amycolatopsis sp. 195334CR]MBN6041834.1 glycosyltransferase family 39 protein [Amycolatopsis sp. 195334CR]